jgi:hypothetical protein
LATESLGGVIVYDTMRDEIQKWKAQNSALSRSWAGRYSLKMQLSRSGVTVKGGLMRRLFGNDPFDRVVAVDLHNCNFSGDQLAYLSGFPLQVIDVVGLCYGAGHEQNRDTTKVRNDLHL